MAQQQYSARQCPGFPQQSTSTHQSSTRRITDTLNPPTANPQPRRSADGKRTKTSTRAVPVSKDRMPPRCSIATGPVPKPRSVLQEVGGNGQKVNTKAPILAAKSQQRQPSPLNKACPISSRGPTQNTTTKSTSVRPGRSTVAIVRPAPKLDRARIPQTNPLRTKALWKTVMERNRAMQETESSRGRKAAAGKAKAASASTRTGSSRSGLQSVASSIEKRPRTSPYDRDFRELVLTPRGISIQRHGSFSETAFAHFGTDEQKDKRIPYYRGLEGAQDTSVWLEADDEFVEEIVREYVCMKLGSLCEAEYATYAKETLLKRDPRYTEREESRRWMTERMIELVARPDGGPLWEAPPPIDPANSGKPYVFDIRPDCSYWLSLQAFNPTYLELVKEYVFVVNKQITSPYLTIEFKRDDDNIDTAMNQIAAASALALYNRYKLKYSRLSLSGQQWNMKRLRTLRHYGLTFTGENYDFWCTTPKLSADWTWQGCIMTRVYGGSCTRKAGARAFIKWMNEIHRWGLTVHGPACQKDVKISMSKRTRGNRPSLTTYEDTEDSDADADADEKDNTGGGGAKEVEAQLQRALGTITVAEGSDSGT